MTQNDHLQKLITEHAYRTGRPATAWAAALAPLPALVKAGCLTWADASTLTAAAAEPDHLRGLLDDWTRADASAEGTPWARLANAVDDSDYSLAAWLESYATITVWLAMRDRSATFDRKLGYLVCTADFARRSTVRDQLVSVLDQMLDEFGMDGE